LQALAERLLEEHRAGSPIDAADRWTAALRRALRNYRRAGELLADIMRQKRIETPVEYAVTVPVFILREDSRDRLVLVDSRRGDPETVLFGTMDRFESAFLHSSFFYIGANYYIEVGFRVSYPVLDSYLLFRNRSQLARIGLTTILLAGIFGFIIHTILQQKRMGDMKGDFISALTHEVNTPLATVAVAAGTLKKVGEQLGDERVVGLAATVDRQNRRLQRMLGTGLAAALMERDGRDIELRPVRVQTVLAELTADFRLGQDRVTVREDYRAGRDLAAIDPELFSLAVRNILDNGVKYCDRLPELSIRVESQDGTLTIAITDNGIGIARKYLKKIFASSFRVPGEAIRSRRGMGLGLSTARRIMEAFGGSIAVTSQPEVGSTFTLTLPVLPEDR
jgi:signal transduction histidine kinase